MDLSSLIPMLRANGVTRFEGYGVVVELSSPVSASSPPAGNPSSVPNDAASGTSFSAPQPTMDLPGTNDAMSADAILNWSAPPSPSDQPLPLTGEEPPKAS